MNRDHIIKDSVNKGWVETMPESVRPFLRLSRYDRPIGFWLLALSGWIGLAFAALSHGFSGDDLKYALLVAIGAVAMRGAGCTYNDIIDKDLDASVDRTALRPLAAGTVTIKAAWLWVALQCAAGAAVLAFFPRLAQILAVSSLALIAAYPFMKRITYWPQAWLGLTFNWAVLVAYVAQTEHITPSLLLLYAGLVFWTIGYDTIYACQDKEDDALIGIKSTARLFGTKTKYGVLVLYLISGFLIVVAVRNSDGDNLAPLFAFPFILHLFWQYKKLDHQDGNCCLELFKSNRTAALLLIAGLSLSASL